MEREFSRVALACDGLAKFPRVMDSRNSATLVETLGLDIVEISFPLTETLPSYDLGFQGVSKPLKPGQSPPAGTPEMIPLETARHAPLPANIAQSSHLD